MKVLLIANHPFLKLIELGDETSVTGRWMRGLEGFLSSEMNSQFFIARVQNTLLYKANTCEGYYYLPEKSHNMRKGMLFT